MNSISKISKNTTYLKIIWNDGTRLIIQSRANQFIKDSTLNYDNITWCGSNCADHYLSVTDIETWLEVTITLNSNLSKVIFGDCIDAIDNLIQGKCFLFEALV